MTERYSAVAPIPTRSRGARVEAAQEGCYSKPVPRTRVVATLGPASWSRIAELIDAGVAVFRLNMSHGTRDEHARTIADIRRVFLHELGHVIAMEHEHQNPFAGIKWHEQAVYDALVVLRHKA